MTGIMTLALCLHRLQFQVWKILNISCCVGVYKIVRFEVFIAVVIHIVIFWVMTSHIVVNDVHFPCNCITYIKFNTSLLLNT
jgi:hypothetical protein